MKNKDSNDEELSETIKDNIKDKLKEVGDILKEIDNGKD